MTKEQLQNLKVGNYITPADVNGKDEGAYIIIDKLTNGSILAVKTAVIGYHNLHFWEAVYTETIETRKVV